MDQVEVEITGLILTSRYGTLSQGQVLRTDADFAAHLVNDCNAAKFIQPSAPVEQIPSPAAKPVKRKATK